MKFKLYNITITYYSIRSNRLIIKYCIKQRGYLVAIRQMHFDLNFKAPDQGNKVEVRSVKCLEITKDSLKFYSGNGELIFKEKLIRRDTVTQTIRFPNYLVGSMFIKDNSLIVTRGVGVKCVAFTLSNPIANTEIISIVDPIDVVSINYKTSEISIINTKLKSKVTYSINNKDYSMSKSILKANKVYYSNKGNKFTLKEIDFSNGIKIIMEDTTSREHVFWLDLHSNLVSNYNELILLKEEKISYDKEYVTTANLKVKILEIKRETVLAAIFDKTWNIYEFDIYGKGIHNFYSLQEVKDYGS